MGDVAKGVEAGFVATVAISILLLIQQAAGVAPQFNLIALIMAAAGTPEYPSLAWIVHFAVGVGAWGIGFAAFSPHLPGPHWVRGLIFGVLTWLATMIAFLPAAGLPMFAQGMGTEIPVVSLVLSLIYGLVLGETYHLLLHYLPSEVDENA
jgi:uncharacterized protein DUF6789